MQMVTETGVSQKQFKVLVVEGLWQIVPPAGVFVNPQPQTERDGEQDGEERSGRVSWNKRQ